jgi:CBS domain-containing protein
LFRFTSGYHVGSFIGTVNLDRWQSERGNVRNIVMKTSVIRYRAADFLKQHPPFNELSEEELLSLAASGRVVFHESNEYIFRTNQPKSPSIWVIQQGSVEIIDETPHGEQLRDLLGEGDLLDSEPGTAPYRNSAKTTSDVILYTIDAKEFAQLAAGNPRVARYLAAQVSISEGYNQDVRSLGFQETETRAVGKTTWLDTPGPPVDFLRRHLLSFRPGATVRKAAIQMANALSNWVAVEDENCHPLGLITGREFLDHIVKGFAPDTSVEAIMNSHLATASPGLTAGDYFLSMMQHRCGSLMITADGSPHSPLEGVITDSDLSLSTGHNPAYLLEQILKSTTVEDWSRLLQQENRILSSALAGPSNIDLCARISTEFLSSMLEAIIRQVEIELVADGFSKPPAEYCWLLFGRAGRGETVVPVQPEFGVVYDDSLINPSSSDPRTYFAAVLERATSYLAKAGLQTASDSSIGVILPGCQSLAEWKGFFQARIADPISNSVYLARTLFDFQPLLGQVSLAAELKQTIGSELKRSGPFIPIMANDTMSNLPPLTFFHGLVVELDGAQRETLDVDSTALRPITDAARVFALAAGNLDVTNTLARLEQAAISTTTHAAVLKEAAQAFRVAAYQQAIAGFNSEGRGSIIRPSILGRYDQRLLKTAFDAIQRLLEVSSTVFDVAA